MVQMVWEFIIKEHARGQFELTYGPGGAWSKLFAHCPGFRGITLLRDTRDMRRYLTVELWDAVAQRQEALAESRAEHSNLAAELADWTETMTEVGVFGVLAEATVRPRGKAGRANIAETGRRSRRSVRRN